MLELEALTNARIRNEAGQLRLVAPEDRVSGAGTTPIMAAFTHINPTPTRFSDGSYGVYYAAHDRETAIAETVFGRERFLGATNEAPIDLDMRVYCARVRGRFDDIRTEPEESPLYDRVSYATSSQYGRARRLSGADGVVCRSVRNPAGENLAAFRPRVISNCYTAGYLGYRWNGRRIIDVFDKSGLWQPYPGQ